MESSVVLDGTQEEKLMGTVRSLSPSGDAVRAALQVRARITATLCHSYH